MYQRGVPLWPQHQDSIVTAVAQATEPVIQVQSLAQELHIPKTQTKTETKKVSEKWFSYISYICAKVISVV